MTSSYDSGKTQALRGDMLRSSALDERTATVVVIQGPEIGRGFPLEAERTVVGRSPDATIVLADPSLSRSQCAFVRGSDGNSFRLADLDSTNGTFLNGKQVHECELHDGDTVQAGDVVLKFSLLNPIEDGFHREMSTRVRSDPHTGLLNLRAFYEELDAAIVIAEMDQRCIGLTMLDIDGLKQVNDQHGHLLGAAVVRGVGECLHAVTQPQRGVAALYGGDEFTAFIVGADEEAMLALGEAVRTRVEQTPISVPSSAAVRVSVCVGIAVSRPGETDRNALVHSADLAMYAAKRAGKNRVVAYRPDMED